MKKTFCLGVSIVMALFFAAHPVFAAADYPTKTVTLINPNAPGGQFDVLGRAFGATAEKALRQTCRDGE